jgi:hypothetical protein
VGGHLSEKSELAQQEVGRKVKLARGSFALDKIFLSFTEKECTRVRYEFQVRRFQEPSGAEKGSLEFYGLEAAKKNQTQRVTALCKGCPVFYCEVAKGHQLAVYYDGWFFFLEKVKNSFSSSWNSGPKVKAR